MSTCIVLERNQVIWGEDYIIDYPGPYRGKRAKVQSVNLNGDATLVFQNGNAVVFHVGWLLSCS